MANFTRMGIPERYIGLSTDVKPTGVTAGSRAYETDTKKTFITSEAVNRTSFPVVVAYPESTNHFVSISSLTG